MDTFCRHLNYLSDELVALSLFSNQLDDEAKEKMRLKLLAEQETESYQQRTSNSIRYIRRDESFADMELHNFITHRSIFLFQTLNTDISFLKKNAKYWKSLASYKCVRKKIKNMFVVVNDSVERALGQTVIAINNHKARTEENLQNLLTSKITK